MAFSIVLLFFISTMTGLTTDLNPLEQQQSLDEEPVVYSAATSPGHVVFAQYISSDNCPHCYKAGGGSAAHHKLKVDFPDEYVYVTYMSASYGDTDSTRTQAMSLHTRGNGLRAVLRMHTSETEQTAKWVEHLPTTIPMITNFPPEVECTAAPMITE